MKKLFYATLITLLGALCLTIQHQNSSYSLLKILSADTFVIDFNHNDSLDKNETYKLDNLEISTNPEDNLSEQEIFILNELAKNFAREFFFNKKIKLDKKGDIWAGNNEYRKAFYNAGFNYKQNPKEYKKLIEDARTNKYYIINLHNLKYHKVGCKHALNTENYQLVNSNDLPKKAKPCLACNSSLEPSKDKNNKKITTFTTNGIKLFFSDHTTQLKPSKNCSSSICKELVSNINNTKNTLDIAIYGYTFVPEIETALINAIKRGVKIRLVYDLDANGNTTYNDSLRLAKLVSQSNNDYSSEGNNKKYSNEIMHNKFYIFDGARVITGSANLSPNDMSGFNSNTTVTIKSEQIAKLYTKEFEQMLNSNFHNKKISHTNTQKFEINETPVEVYFSPQDRITKNHIIPLIKSAKQYIYLPAFLITDKWLADELITAKVRGVEIKVILDASQAHSQYSKIKQLRESGIPVKVENYAGKLHTKSIIIDDKISIIGSMNFSKSGQNINDENVLIIKNNGLTKEYRQYFEYLWNRIDNKWLTRIPRAESIDSIGSCTDGIDNNYDKMIDSSDEGCKSINKY